jgi:hypothetical protein
MWRMVPWVVMMALTLASASSAMARDIDVQGKLESGDATLPELQYYDAYPVQVSAGETVRIEIIGMAMTPTLLVYNAASELVHRDMGSWYPGGYGFDGQWQPEASGSHWIVVTQSWPGATDYHLRVTFPR